MQANTRGMPKLGKRITRCLDMQELSKDCTAPKVKTAENHAAAVELYKPLLEVKATLVHSLEHKEAFLTVKCRDMIRTGEYDDVARRLGRRPDGMAAQLFNFEDPYMHQFIEDLEGGGGTLVEDILSPALKELFEKGELGVKNVHFLARITVWLADSGIMVVKVSEIALGILDNDYSIQDDVSEIIRNKKSKNWIRKYLVERDGPWQRRATTFLDKVTSCDCGCPSRGAIQMVAILAGLAPQAP
jgi:hypothetical protein